MLKFFKKKKEESKLIDVEKYRSWINEYGTNTNIHDLPEGKYLTILYKHHTKVFKVSQVRPSDGMLFCRAVEPIRHTVRSLNPIDNNVVDLNEYKTEYNNCYINDYYHELSGDIFKKGKAIWDCAVKIDD